MTRDPATQSFSVFVRGLRLEASVGLYPRERERRQPVVIDVELRLAPRTVRSLRDTVDYGRLAAIAREIALPGHTDLVETLAERLAARCLELPGALFVRVRVEKPEALEGAAGAGVEIARGAGTSTPQETFETG